MTSVQCVRTRLECSLVRMLDDRSKLTAASSAFVSHEEIQAHRTRHRRSVRKGEPEAVVVGGIKRPIQLDHSNFDKICCHHCDDETYGATFWFN